MFKPRIKDFELSKEIKQLHYSCILVTKAYLKEFQEYEMRWNVFKLAIFILNIFYTTRSINCINKNSIRIYNIHSYQNLTYTTKTYELVLQPVLLSDILFILL